jgi:hypothetical protein
MPGLLAALDGSSVIDAEFKEDLASYLAKNGSPPVKSLDEIVSRGLFHAALEGVFNARLAAKGRDSYEYRIALAKRSAIQQTILKTMEDQKLDALVYPTIRRKPSLVNAPQGGSGCQLSASTGFPAISMPAGFTADGLPVGVELLGRAFDDAKLVSFAYAHEQATHHRRAPLRTPALAGRSSIPLMRWQSNAQASGASGKVSANFTFDPATNELTYSLTAAGFAEGEIVSATIHRASKGENGPAISVVSNHAFKNIAGTEKLSDPDRENMISGKLYLRIGTRSKITDNMRIPLKPTTLPAAKQ